ncbi:hypothetical protein [Shewanella algae]|uniref:hypothetical protein n=1 Tax=Shewanella algae TaxID=38313 RepID=UPI001AAFD84C|nr:hypothetical protein [Shewanella algae]MBO2586080.1 hypothetical protein [Shewanella algae]
MLESKVCSLVLGGHVNGYSIVSELYSSGITEIVLFDYGRSISRFSNKLVSVSAMSPCLSDLKDKILRLKDNYDYIVIFPTDDKQLEVLAEIYDDINAFCYVPVNVNSLKKALDKSYQYEVCEKIGVPYPRSKSIKISVSVNDFEKLKFPIIIKPITRQDLSIKVFRNLYLDSLDSLLQNLNLINTHLQNGVEFLVSEFIPGDDTNIYAYTCFKDRNGDIKNEWAGKKLTQYPDNYGVVCSASNEFPDEVFEQGRKLVSELDVYGVIEPEFKYDYRENSFKLMEVNLRSMMWNKVGSASNVNLHVTLFNSAIGREIIKYEQETKETIHTVLMLHEIPNLITRKGYIKHFKHNLFGGKRRVWMIFDKNDIKPFLFSLLVLFKIVGRLCLKK